MVNGYNYIPLWGIWQNISKKRPIRAFFASSAEQSEKLSDQTPVVHPNHISSEYPRIHEHINGAEDKPTDPPAESGESQRKVSQMRSDNGRRKKRSIDKTRDIKNLCPQHTEPTVFFK